MQSKTRRCSWCKKKVQGDQAIVGGLRAFCSFEHLKEYQNSQKGKQYVKQAQDKEKRKQRSIAKEKLKTAGDYVKEAQAAVNAYIRFRDRHDGCISCGSMPENKLGGTFDAGHYRSRGSAGHLRFNLLNIHKQCVRCNRYGSGQAVEYRINLIKKIGADNVEKLETDNSIRKFDIEYLKRIKRIFQKRLRIHKKIASKKD